MSIYCGKCDVWDTLVSIGRVTDESDWSKITIYQNGERLKINSLKELLPYAPYLIGIYMHSNDRDIIYMSKESFVDKEERESLEWRLERAQRAYKRYKKEGIPFDIEKAVKEIAIAPQPCDYEICRRVAEHPYTKNISGLHTRLHDMYREALYNDMVAAGYSEDYAHSWCYK